MTLTVKEMPIEELEARVEIARTLLAELAKFIPFLETLPLYDDEEPDEPVPVPSGDSVEDKATQILDVLGLRTPPRDAQGLAQVIARGMKMVLGLFPGLTRLSDEERERLQRTMPPLDELRYVVEACAPPPRPPDTAPTHEERVYAFQLDRLRRAELMKKVSDAIKALKDDLLRGLDRISRELGLPPEPSEGSGGGMSN